MGGELPDSELLVLEGQPPGRTGGIQWPPGVQGCGEGRAAVSVARRPAPDAWAVMRMCCGESDVQSGQSDVQSKQADVRPVGRQPSCARTGSDSDVQSGNE